MQILAEISLYPLTQDYDALILDFVRRIRQYDGIEVTVGQTSTVVRGEYEVVFQILQRECGISLSAGVKTAVVIKLLNGV